MMIGAATPRQTFILYRRNATWGQLGYAGKPTKRNIFRCNWTTRRLLDLFPQRSFIQLTIPAPTWCGAGTMLDHRGNMASKDTAEATKPDYQGLQERRLVPGSKVYGKAGCTSLSRTSVWRGVREGWFPSPVSVSPGRIAWFEDEVTSWLASRPRLRSDSDAAKQRERLLPAAPRH